MNYVTPGAFRVMGTGADVSDLTDAQLATILSAASARVNRYCAAPRSPKPYDFRGGQIGDVGDLELHRWDVGSMFRAGSDRVYPYCYPVKSIETFRLRVTVTQTVNFAAADIYINNTERYLEVISLAERMSVFSAGYVPTLGLRVPVAELAYTYGYSFPVANEDLYLDPNATASGVYRAEDQWWDSGEDVTVYVDGEATASGLFTVDYDEGTVTFADGSIPATTAAVTADFTFTLPNEVHRATALVAADFLTRKALQESGLTGIEELRVEETQVRMRQIRSGTVDPLFDDTVRGPAAELLRSFVFRSLA